MPSYPEEIEYSDKYVDEVYEYRHVLLPKRVMKEMFRVIQSVVLDPKKPPAELRILSETEWRSLGVQQSRGWQHYEVHRPEPHILLFRRPLGTNPATGLVDSIPAGNPVKQVQAFC